MDKNRHILGLLHNENHEGYKFPFQFIKLAKKKCHTQQQKKSTKLFQKKKYNLKNTSKAQAYNYPEFGTMFSKYSFICSKLYHEKLEKEQKKDRKKKPLKKYGKSENRTIFKTPSK